MLLNVGYFCSIILFGYHWAMGRGLNYSATLAAYGLASYICYRNIIYLSQSLNMLLKFVVICHRASEILEMDERYDYNDTSIDASADEF